MANKCEVCAEKCPQAEMTHNVALGRMYATNEFITLLKKVENGELVEVVRCKDCRYSRKTGREGYLFCTTSLGMGRGVVDADFCSEGERNDNERKAD